MYQMNYTNITIKILLISGEEDNIKKQTLSEHGRLSEKIIDTANFSK